MKVNEIFYSLQGEGHFTGTAAVFLRLSGCNLACSFCDTLHQDGRQYTDQEILQQIREYPSRHVVITGGEPALQLTSEFVDLLHDNGYFVQVETNGTIPVPENVDWITCSPKSRPICYRAVNELKVVFQDDGDDFSRFDTVEAGCRYLQPCDVNDVERNAAITGHCIEFIKRNPQWRLSLQTHKILGMR